MAKATITKKEVVSSAKKRFSGVVTSDKMQDTIVVSITRYVKHPKYKKYLKRAKKFHAHDEGNTKKIGERVTIEECRPISKTKRFTLVK